MSENPLATARGRQVGWGYQLLVDGRGGCRASLASLDVLLDLVAEVVLLAGMRPFGDPLAEHFGHASPETAGWTVVQLIETSSVTLHALERTGEYYLDLFSCRKFPTGVVVGAVEAALGGELYHRYLVRGPRS